MADSMVIDVDGLKKPEMNGWDHDNSAKKSLKRKRASLVESLSTEDRAARIDALRQELNGLFKYYREVLDQKVILDLSNSTIACLLEESNLPLSKLVDGIYEKVKAKESITLASVKSSVLLIGQRSYYGIPNPDADVLEDETESRLWCWETRCKINARIYARCTENSVNLLEKDPREDYCRFCQVIGPCHPFMKDPELEYDIDSDEEWEEEEPGESLSDCDKDDEEERYSKVDDEDENEDGFFVRVSLRK